MKKLSIIFAVVFLFCAPSGATMLLEIDQAGQVGGTISYDGVGGPLVGVDIPFSEITGVDTPLNSGVELLMDDALLNFATGNLQTTSPSITDFLGGGSWNLWVDIPAQSGFSALVGTLATGFIFDAKVIDGGFALQMVMTGTDTKLDQLLNFYGLPDLPFQYAFTAQSLDFTKFPNGGFIMNEVQNADIIQSVIPEPHTMFFVGIGMLGFSLLLRRKK